MTCLTNLRQVTKHLNRVPRCSVTQAVLDDRGLKVLQPLSGILYFSTSSRCNMDISGIYPPIATPFNKDETVAYDKLKHNMDKWNKIPLRGYVVLGSNGESVYLTIEERVEVVRKATEMAGKDKLVIAGAGCESTRETISLSRKMAEAGAKALLIVTPCFYKGSMNNEALISHYTKVADASPVPVILYSVPGNTTIDIPAEVAVQLSTHPNIVGIKDSGGNVAKLGQMVYKTQNNDFQVLAGSASFLLPAYTVGCVGGICGLANILGQECCDLEQLFKQGKVEEAKELQHRLIGPNMGVTARFGVPGLKTAMEWFGYYGGPARSPLQPLSQNNVEILKKIFQDTGFL